MTRLCSTPLPVCDGYDVLLCQPESGEGAERPLHRLRLPHTQARGVDKNDWISSFLEVQGLLLSKKCISPHFPCLDSLVILLLPYVP